MKNGSSLVSKLWQILILTQSKILYSLAAAIGIFLVEYGSLILQIIEADSQLPEGALGKTVSQHAYAFLQYLSDFPVAKDIAVGLVWAGAALLAYLAFIAVGNLMIVIRNEIVVDTEYSKGSVAKALITRFGKKIIVAVSFVAFVAVSLVFLLPYWTSMLSIYVLSGMMFSNILYLIFGLLGLAANIYVIWIAAFFAWAYEEEV